MEQTGCPETLACKSLTPGNYPEGSIQHSEHGEKFEIKNSLYMFKKVGKFSHFLLGYRHSEADSKVSGVRQYMPPPPKKKETHTHTRGDVSVIKHTFA